MSALGQKLRRGWGTKQAGDKGANLVEFAIVMPLLLILILGIVEFGFVLAQMNEVRHGAREGARYAAVSRPDYNVDSATGDNADVLDVTCDAIGLPGVTIEVALTYVEADGDSNPNRLEYGTVTVEADTEPLTGFPLITDLLPDTLTSDAQFRLEQDAGWTGFASTSCP